MDDRFEINFNNIYTTYYKKSFLFVKSYVHDEVIAEDIVSDALIKLWEQMRKQTIDPIAPYLFSMLKNSSLDYLKQKTIRRDVHGILTDSMERELEIRTNSLESSDPREIFSDEIQRIIEETLEKLPEKTREIFILSRFGNKSHKEISTLFNVSVKGVDYHIAKSVSVLRVALRDYLPIIGMLPFLRV